MKKIFALLLVALVALSCTGCGENNKKTSYSKTTYSSYYPITTAPSFDFDEDLDYDFDFDHEDENDEDEENDDQIEDDHISVTVYVSKSGKIHRIRNCSGMKYYTEMDYDEAVDEGYVFCKNCY